MRRYFSPGFFRKALVATLVVFGPALLFVLLSPSLHDFGVNSRGAWRVMGFLVLVGALLKALLLVFGSNEDQIDSWVARQSNLPKKGVL